MSDFATTLTRDWLQEASGEENYNAGRHLYLADRVRLVDATVLQAKALVKDVSVYSVRLSIDSKQKKPKASCDCRANSKKLCRHSVAAGLAVQAWMAQNGMLRTATTSKPTAVKPNAKSSCKKQTRSHSKKTEIMVMPQRAQVRRLKPWEGFVNQLSSVQHQESSLWVALFQIDLRRDFWFLDAKKARLKKDGSLGKAAHIKDADLNDATLLLSEKERFVLHYLGARTEQIDLGYTPAYIRPRRGYFHYGGESGYLLQLLQESRLYLSLGSFRADKSLRWSTEHGRVAFRTHIRGTQIECRPLLIWGDVEEPIGEQHAVLTSNPIYLLRETTLIELEQPRDAGCLLPFTNADFSLRIPRRELPEFLQRIESNRDFAQNLVLSENLEIEEHRAEPKPRLYLQAVGGRLVIDLRFTYDTFELSGRAGSAFHYTTIDEGQKLVRVRRDLPREQHFERLLLQSGARAQDDGLFGVNETDAIAWLLDQAPALAEAGFEISGREAIEQFKVRQSTPRIEMAVSSEIDWFDLKLVVDFDGFEVSLKALKKALSSGSPYIELADGSTARIPENWVQRFQHLLQLGATGPKSIKLSRAHAALIDSVVEGADTVDFDAEFTSLIRKLRNFEGIRQAPVPESLQGKLRPYQKTGYDWLLFLQEFRFGGCLADDMGLGKTIQTLALLLHEKEKGVSQPSLIVCPKSVVFNWEQEISRFAPSLRVLRHEGTDRARSTEEFDTFDIILMTYGIMRRDIDFLRQHVFHYAILDESQYIKNPESQTARAARKLKSNYRLVLTGTPIENNTIELWSQMAFLNPGLLGSQRYFKRAFATPIEKHRNQVAAEFLQKMIYPFILRRKKEQVEKELPPKTESLFFAEMLPEQQQLYTYWRDYYRAAILQVIDKKGLARSRITVLEGLMKLRQIACHPRMLDPAEACSSGKYEAFVELLEEIVAEGHKVLVFSQFVKMLSLLRAYLDERKLDYEYLDGSTQNRKERVKNFQENEAIKIFLISLRAGGTGLNLTAADYVIHYDPWWNPAVELQATDRTHRIGQSRHVFVYKLITKNTVEEKVLQLQQRKQELAENLITTERAFFKQLTRDDIQLLFS